jgi:hypothetical protein
VVSARPALRLAGAPAAVLVELLSRGEFTARSWLGSLKSC